jgi:hypothetical protein
MNILNLKTIITLFAYLFVAVLMNGSMNIFSAYSFKNLAASLGHPQA